MLEDEPGSCNLLLGRDSDEEELSGPERRTGEKTAAVPDAVRNESLPRSRSTSSVEELRLFEMLADAPFTSEDRPRSDDSVPKWVR